MKFADNLNHENCRIKDCESAAFSLKLAIREC